MECQCATKRSCNPIIPLIYHYGEENKYISMYVAPVYNKQFFSKLKSYKG